MNYKEIKELIKLVEASGLAEFKLKDKDFELSIRTEKYTKDKAPQIVSVASTPVAAPMAAQPIAAPRTPDVPPADASAAPEAGLLEIKSPIVGTLYRSSTPEKPPFAKVGDTIEVGQVVCIVEAMKLFNEIESEVAGKIVKVVVDDASPVEYDQVLFLVDPQG